MKILIPLFAACIVSTAHAQPPVAAPPEVTDRVNDIAQIYRLTTSGSTIMRELDDGDQHSVDVTVAPDKLTFIALGGDDAVIELDVQATVNGKEIAAASGDAEPMLEISAGSGANVRLTVEMSCQDVSCGYFVQTFVR